jgi:endoglucanase
LETAAALAAASRVMKGYNDTLATQCLQIAQEVWKNTPDQSLSHRVALAVELFITTKDKTYADYLVNNTDAIANRY